MIESKKVRPGAVRVRAQWALGLMIVLMICQFTLSVVLILSLFNLTVYVPQAILDIIAQSGYAYMAMIWISGIASLIWLHEAAKNAKILRPSFEYTPNWAVGWYFVPFANLYKPYVVMRDIWLASKGPTGDRYPKEDEKLALWWWTRILGGIAASILNRAFREDGSFHGAGALTPEFAYVCVNLGVLFSTGVFFLLVKESTHLQVTHSQRLIDTF